MGKVAHYLRLNIGLSSPNILLKLHQLRRQLNIRLQELLRIQCVFTFITSMFLNIQSDGRTRAACPRETNDNAGAVGKFDIETLVGGHAAVEISIGEIAGRSNLTVYLNAH